MHISHEEMTSDRKKVDRHKEIGMKLNIPFMPGGPDGQWSDGESEKEEWTKLKKEEDFSKLKETTETGGRTKDTSREALLKSRHTHQLELTLASLARLTIRPSPEPDSSSTSEDEEERKKLEQTLTPKGPDKTKNAKREIGRIHVKPYYPTRLPTGGLSPGSNGAASLTSIAPSPSTFLQIPTTVEEFETPSEPFDDGEVQKVLSELDSQQKSLFMMLLEQAQASLLDGGPGGPGGGLGPQQTSSRGRTGSRPRAGELDLCNSPDSSYGTMSPASVPPSPISLHSPNPRATDLRHSESDSAGEGELGPSELAFQQIPTLCQLQSGRPVLHYAQPRNATFSAPINNYQRRIVPDSELVTEYGMEKDAISRLKEKKLFKNNIFDVEWAIACQEFRTYLTHGKISPQTEVQLRRNLVKLIEGGQEGAKRRHFYEELYSRVRLYKKHCPGWQLLAGKDLSEDSPLHAAAISRPATPLVARFLVDTLLQDFNPPLQIFDAEGNTILHKIAAKGDSHAHVLAELLHSKAFDVNHKNASSLTALHKAVQAHPVSQSLALVKLFIKNGAFVRLQDLYGRTPLHLAVMAPQSDPNLLRQLLMSTTAKEAINIVDNDRNTPLHIAVARNDLPLPRHLDIISQLMSSKARHDIRNKEEKIAVLLAADDRRAAIQSILNGKNPLSGKK